MKLFNALVRDQPESVVVEGQVSRAKSSDSDQALKASDSVRDQFSPHQPESKSKSTRLVQFKTSSAQVYQYQAVVRKVSVY